MKPEKDANPSVGPLKQKKRFLRHQVPTERKDKTTIAGCLREFPEPNALGARPRHGRTARKIGDASDFSLGHGGSAIP